MDLSYNQGMAKEWDADEALSALEMESSVHGSESDAECATRILCENTPRAVLAIVHLAQHSANEQTRLRAAQYVVDRVLGRIGENNPAGNEDPFERMTKALTSPVSSTAGAATAATSTKAIEAKSSE